MPLVLKLAEPKSAIDAEKLSAWLDGASQHDCADDVFTSKVLASNTARATWDTYHLIGDVMRTPDLAIAPTPAFSAKLAQALAAESAHQAVHAVPSSRPFARWTWPGLALAAALALVFWVARPFLFDLDPDAAVLAEQQRQREAVAAFNDYLDAHRQLVGPGMGRQPAWRGGAQVQRVNVSAGASR